MSLLGSYMVCFFVFVLVFFYFFGFSCIVCLGNEVHGWSKTALMFAIFSYHGRGMV